MSTLMLIFFNILISNLSLVFNLVGWVFLKKNLIVKRKDRKILFPSFYGKKLYPQSTRATDLWLLKALAKESPNIQG